MEQFHENTITGGEYLLTKLTGLKTMVSFKDCHRRLFINETDGIVWKSLTKTTSQGVHLLKKKITGSFETPSQEEGVYERN